MKTINTSKIKTRRTVSGALYDFCAYITSLKKTITVGSTEDPLGLLDALITWSKERGLNIDDEPDLNSWDQKV
jgi:hypothetical protein